MNFYPFHIGDYLSHTAHLEPLEDLAYRRIIDLYYLRDGLIPKDPAEVAKLIRMRVEVEIVKSILSEFFINTEEGWSHSRCDSEISDAQSKRAKARESAAKRWQSEGNADAMQTQSEGNAPNPNPNPNPNPTKKKLSADFSDDFEIAWGKYPNRPGASKRDAFKAWRARIASGVDASVMINGVERYAAYCEATRTEPQFVKQPTTFFGPNEHYLSDWSVHDSQNKKGRSIHDERKEWLDKALGKRNERDITAHATRLD